MLLCFKLSIGQGSSGRLTAHPEQRDQHECQSKYLARAYACLDVFVHTGTRETFGQTIQEAAATALPVVAPDRGGPRDLVEHGVTGLLFAPDDPRDLRRQVESLTVRPDSWQRRALLGETALDRVQGRSWGRLVDTLIGHYEAVCSGKRLATRLS